MMNPGIEQLDRELRRIARSGAPQLEGAISSLLAGELSERAPAERLQLLEELSRRFAAPAHPETATAQAGGAAGAEMTRLVLQFVGRSPEAEASAPEIVENFARSLDLLFDSLNEIISVIHVRLLGESPELETIRKVIGKNLESGSGILCVKDYLEQIQRAFLAAHGSFQCAANTVISELLSELDPALLEQEKGAGFRFGPLKKADLFERYEERHARCRRWLDSGQCREALLREFEKNCRQTFQGR